MNALALERTMTHAGVINSLAALGSHRQHGKPHFGSLAAGGVGVRP
jgi:hypothetical protein